MSEKEKQTKEETTSLDESVIEEKDVDETKEEVKEEKKKLSKEEKDQLKKEKQEAKEEEAYSKKEEKWEKAYALKEELAKEIDDLKEEIINEPDQKKKNKLRAKRDNLIAQRNAIVITPDKATIPMSPNKKKIIKAVIAVVVVLALLFTYVATGFCKKGLAASLGWPQSTFSAFTITDQNGQKHHVKVTTYNYYFAMYYNNLQSTVSQYEQYGIDLESANMNVDFDQKLSKQIRTTDGEDQTWLEYIQDQVKEGIKDTYMYYYMALDANDGEEPEITEDQQTELDDTLDDYETTAEGYGYTLSGYLEAAMGKGVTEEVFRREATISYISENYQEDYQEELSNKEYSQDELDEYKEENLTSLQSIDVKLFECDSEDDAIAFKEALKSDGSNFADLASEYSSDDWDKEANLDPVETTYNNMTYGTLKNLSFAISAADEDDSTSYSNLDWLYSSDRQAGDSTQYSTTVAYIVTPVYLSDQKTVNVRHILIKPVSEDDSDEDSDDTSSSSTDAKDCTEEEWETAYEKAEEILDEYNSGDKTEDSFADLAEENSEDSNADDGGLYENVVPNQMVPTFNAWCFDSSRQSGDVAIVKTEYGYHIMYFVGYGDYSVWEYTAQQALASEDSTETLEDLEEEVTIKTCWLGSRYFEIDTDIDS